MYSCCNASSIDARTSLTKYGMIESASTAIGPIRRDHSSHP